MLEPILLAMDSVGRWLESWFFGTWSVSTLVITGVIGVCLWFFLSRPKQLLLRSKRILSSLQRPRGSRTSCSQLWGFPRPRPLSSENPVIQKPRCRLGSSRGPDQALTVMVGREITVNLNVGK